MKGLKTITIYVSEEEYNELQNKSKKSGLKVSIYYKYLLTLGQIKEKENKNVE